jgi:hypothetical protein
MREYLKQVPSTFVFENLSKGLKANRKIVSTQLILSIEERLLSEESFNSRFEALSQEAKKICSLAYLFGDSGLTLKGHKHYQEELLSSFLVYIMHDKRNSADHYLGLLDIAEKYFDRFSECLFTGAMVSVKFSPRQFFLYRCLNDTMLVFIFALRGALKKKRDGGIMQSTFDELCNKLHTTTQSCTFGKKEAGVRAVIDMIVAYGLQSGLLTEIEKTYAITTKRITTWLSKNPKELFDDFCRFTWHYTGAWDRKIHDALLGRTQEASLSAVFFQEYCPEVCISVLQMMHYVGLIDAVSSDREIVWGRGTRPGDVPSMAEGEQITIMADFSAILPQEVLPELLYSFSLVGTITVLDQVYKGVINRTTVHQSLTNGVSSEELLRHLLSWNSPENVIETVREWIREYSRLYVLHADFVVVCDQKTSAQLNSFQPLEGIMEPVASHSVFRIKKGCEKDVWELLEEMGFDPRVPDAGSDELEQKNDKKMIESVESDLELLFDIEPKNEETARPVKTGKYSEELKQLDLAELNHVIHYALLMGYQLRFEYEGSPYIKSGVYTVTPVSITTDRDPILEAKTSNETIKKFFINKIVKIGVKSA